MARLAFFGTPQFALPSLLACHHFCINNAHELVVVVTQKDKEQGRGQHLIAPPVKTCAQALGVRVLQPETLRKNHEEGAQFFDEFSRLNIDLAVVVAYGKLIPERILKIPRCGFINIHASLLPRFRGAAPIQRAIEAGDKETGVCVMDMVKALDEGDVFACAKTPILGIDTSATLFRRLSHLGAALLSSSLPKLLKNELPRVAQGEHGVVYARMLDKDEGVLDFTQPGKTLCFRTRAFDPWPSVFGVIRGKRVKFFDSFFLPSSTHQEISPGTIVCCGKFLGVRTIDGILYFQTMQLEGKRAMAIHEALRGFPISVGERIE